MADNCASKCPFCCEQHPLKQLCKARTEAMEGAKREGRKRGTAKHKAGEWQRKP
jgi:hypothetical protein